MSKSQKGRYKVKNKEKYINPKRVDNVIYRSSWEKTVMLWLDQNSDIKRWGSEEVVVNYISRADLKPHKYYTDFYIQYTSGRVVIVEVKPYHETQPPVKKESKTKNRYLMEVKKYAVNQSKWEAADAFAKANNAEFEVWTEKELSALGLNTKTSQKFKAYKFGNSKGRKGSKKKQKSKQSKRNNSASSSIKKLI